jgi:predicted DNA-binding WGR domain protein
MVYLTKIDPSRNMARFYVLDVQPNLFGEWALCKEWGRIGRPGRRKHITFVSETEARAALAVVLPRRRKRGYVRPVKALGSTKCQAF